MQVEIDDGLKKEFHKDQSSGRMFPSERRVTANYGNPVYKTLKVIHTKLESADSLSDIRGYKNCEELRGDRKGQLSMRLDRKRRLIFEPVELAGQSIRKPDKGLDWSKVTAVRVLEIVDYH